MPLSSHSNDRTQPLSLEPPFWKREIEEDIFRKETGGRTA
jgi:hypothetical protein